MNEAIDPDMSGRASETNKIEYLTACCEKWNSDRLELPHPELTPE